MKKMFIFGLTVAINTFQAQVYANDLSQQDESKPSIMYVCGGNTGRSVMAEWYTRSHYSQFVNDFSRGSGIDPQDDIAPEKYAEELILESHEATNSQLMLQHATPATIQDINAATIVLVMTKAHQERLNKLIDRECLPVNITARELSASSALQWQQMCANKSQLKSKIHTLIGCATGKDGDISDASGKDREYYISTRNDIIKYSNMVMQQYIKHKQWCTK